MFSDRWIKCYRCLFSDDRNTSLIDMSSCWLESPVSLLLTLLLQVNYQYRHGTSFPVALRTIYADGGIPRFYRGVIPALAQGPLSRFGDTAANTGMLTLLDSFEVTKDLNVGYKTVAASIAAGLFRIVLMPVVCVCSIFLVLPYFRCHQSTFYIQPMPYVHTHKP